MEYIVSKHTHYDDENELFYTYVGTNGPEMPLLCSAWGKTEEESKRRAHHFLKLLEGIIPLVKME